MFKGNFLLKLSLTTLFLLPFFILVKSDKASSNLALTTAIKPTLMAQNPQKQTERKVALVIGNSQYKINPLANPVNDANDMAIVLEELGFEVIKVLDSDLIKMTEAVNNFQQKLGPGVVGLFFYAGHGMQVDGENYLLPTDAILKTKDAVKNETISVSNILKKMQAANTKMNIIILDACRNDPFKRSWGEEQTRNFSLGGLAPIDAKVGSLIAYSTAPGDYASDGYGKNSPYTAQLKQHIKEPNLDIEIMFRNVRSGVYQETKGNQIPWVSVSITEGFAFNSISNNTNFNKPITPNTQDTNNLPVIVAARAIETDKMYERLEYFLSNKQWQKADQQTWEIMRQVNSYGRKITLEPDEINNFSCQDLTKIDQLWLQYSNNKFGLTVQEKLFQSLGGNNDRNSLRKLALKLGWRRQNNSLEEYLSYNELNFSDNAPVGHFPTTAGIDGLSSVARNWALYSNEYESFLNHLLERVAVCK